MGLGLRLIPDPLPKVQVPLPGQFFPQVNELSAGAVFTNQGKLDTGFGAISDFHLSVLRTQFGLHPSRMSRIHLDIGGLQLGSQMNGELIQRSLRSVIGEGLEWRDRASRHRLQRKRTYDASQVDDPPGRARRTRPPPRNAG